MLTRHDRTVPEALELVATAAAAGIRDIGFKDIGLPVEALAEVTAAIRRAGGTVYLEVVSLDEASERRSAEAAVGLGVDWLLGGTRPQAVLPVLAGSGLRYAPFPGRIAGHPSRLEGTPAEIVEAAQRLAEEDGVDGLDLLAWRFAGDAGALLAAVCRAVAKPVIVAGSIDRPERIAELARAGAAAFTVGTAAFEARFPAAEPGLAGQLRAILAAARAAG